MYVHTHSHRHLHTNVYTYILHKDTFFLKRTKVNLKEVENRIVVASLGRVLEKTGECLWHKGGVVRTQGHLSLDENNNF